MRTPKPPTARSVSATLRAADLPAARDDREGYVVEWHGTPGASAVRVSYEANDDESLRLLALKEMTAVLRRKGWLVREGRTGRLLVTAMEG
jgi:hypothetical protein